MFHGFGEFFSARGVGEGERAEEFAGVDEGEEGLFAVGCNGVKFDSSGGEEEDGVRLVLGEIDELFGCEGFDA